MTDKKSKVDLASRMNRSSSNVDDIRQRIIAQADAQGENGWMDIAVPAEISASGYLRVPRGAMEMWAVARAHGDHLAQPWTVISPRGLKMQGDDPYHSDWMLGAGLDPQAMRPSGGNPHWEALQDAAYAAKGEVERRLLGFECSVLLTGPFVQGRVHHPKNPADLPQIDEDCLPPIVVVRDCSATWLEVAVSALDQNGAVIVERGGEMAHLVTVLRETNQGPILRMEKARALYPAGSVLQLHPATGEIRLADDQRLIDDLMAQARDDIALPTLIAEPGEARAAPREPTLAAPDKRPSGTTRKAAKPRASQLPFGLREVPRGERAKLNDSYDYEVPVTSLEWPGHSAYATFLCDETQEVRRHYHHFGFLAFPEPKGRTAMLRVSVHSADAGRGSARSFYSAWRKWEAGEAKEACRAVLTCLSPETVAAWEVERARKRQACSPEGYPDDQTPDEQLEDTYTPKPGM